MKPTFNIPNIEYSIFKFPSGELQIQITNDSGNIAEPLDIHGSILSSDQLVELLILVDELRSKGYLDIHLTIPYCAYSRQDRPCGGAAFSLKTFSKLINSCNFTTVTTYDAHSDVAPALLNDCVNVPLLSTIRWSGLDANIYDAFIAPDAGANKKVYDVASYYKKPMIRADKVRNVNTGKILETEIFADTADLENKTVLILDDICQGGRTFIELAKAIKAKAPTCNIHLYVTHGFFNNSVQPLIDAGISKIITTDSVFNIQDYNVAHGYTKHSDAIELRRL